MTIIPAHFRYQKTGCWFDDHVGVPMDIVSRQEPMVKRTGTPVWILVRYINNSQMTPKEVSDLWRGDITEQEVQAAYAYWQTFPWRVEDKLAEEA